MCVATGPHANQLRLHAKQPQVLIDSVSARANKYSWHRKVLDRTDAVAANHLLATQARILLLAATLLIGLTLGLAEPGMSERLSVS
jgi:hypothetical protein